MDLTIKQFNDHNLVFTIARKIVKNFEIILHYSLSNPLMTANQNLLQLTRK